MEFLNYLNITPTNVYLYQDSTEFQVLSEYIAARQTISPVIEGRIVADTTTVNVGVEENKDLIPNRFQLKQNYPNPFNPTTTLSFVIGHQSLVSLKVYNLLGEEVATIVNKELPAGDYKYHWNASNLASGVYFYRLKAEKFIDTKKLILLK